jgi:hypothetical protein
MCRSVAVNALIRWALGARVMCAQRSRLERVEALVSDRRDGIDRAATVRKARHCRCGDRSEEFLNAAED